MAVIEEQQQTEPLAAARMRQVIAARKSTLLAVGPMSKNCVDAVLELSKETKDPLTLIASRRQIEAAELGGGYVNNWTTETFVEYVRERDPAGRVILARDHGGPWQNIGEVANNLSLEEAMQSAKKSLAVDIRSGFDVVHLDPSVDIHNLYVEEKELLQRLFDLLQFCQSAARNCGRQLVYEIGTEEQNGTVQSPEILEVFLQKVMVLCRRIDAPLPFFVVVQTGTKVLETDNVGVMTSLEGENNTSSLDQKISPLVAMCEKYGVFMKEHNTDYLPDDVLAIHPSLGIHAANVAPEFGVAETKQILQICERFGLTKEREDFLQLSLDSGKWLKWLKPNSNPSDFEKSVIAGHYVFSNHKFLSIKKRINQACRRNGFDLENSLRGAVKESIRRYLIAFNLLTPVPASKAIDQIPAHG